MERGGGRELKAEGSAGADREALNAAYEAADYDAWKALMSARGGKILELINADNFARFAEAKLLQSSGKDEEAEAIMDELGLPFHGKGARSGRHSGEMPSGE